MIFLGVIIAIICIALIFKVYFRYLSEIKLENKNLQNQILTKNIYIRSLSIDNAKAQVLPILEENQILSTNEPQQKEYPLASQLSPELKNLLSRFGTISTGGSELYISIEELAVLTPYPSFIRIGNDFDSILILVRPHEEPLYITDGEENDDELVNSVPDFPSVYHWMLSKVIKL